MKKKKLNEAIWFDKDKDGKDIFRFVGEWYEMLGDHLPIDITEEFISTRFGKTHSAKKILPYNQNEFYNDIDPETGKILIGNDKEHVFKFPMYSIYNTGTVSFQKNKQTIEKNMVNVFAKFKNMINNLSDKDIDFESIKKAIQRSRYIDFYSDRDLTYTEFKLLDDNKPLEAFLYYTAILICQQFHIGNEDTKPAANMPPVAAGQLLNRNRPRCNIILLPETKSNVLKYFKKVIEYVAKDVVIIENAFIKAEPEDIRFSDNPKSNAVLNKLEAIKQTLINKKNEERANGNLDYKWSAKGIKKNWLRHFRHLYNINKKVFPNNLSQYSENNPICILDDLNATRTTLRNCYDSLVLNGLNPNACFGIGIFKSE